MEQDTYTLDINGEEGTISLIKILGEGNFGKVFSAKLNDKIVAVKIEELHVSVGGFDNEIEVIDDTRMLEKTIKQIPTFFGYGEASPESDPCVDHRLLIMELFPLTVNDDQHGLPVSRIASDMLRACEFMSSYSYANLDIKGDNICYRHSDDTFVMIDFGICGIFPDKFTAIGNTLQGTPDFASIDALAGCEITERGQLQNLLFTIISLLIKYSWNLYELTPYFEKNGEDAASITSLDQRTLYEVISIKSSFFPCFEDENPDAKACVDQFFSVCGMKPKGPLYEFALVAFGMGYFDDVDYDVLCGYFNKPTLGKLESTKKFCNMGNVVYKEAKKEILLKDYTNLGDVPSTVKRSRWMKAIMNKKAHVYKTEEACFENNEFTIIETYTMGTKIIYNDTKESFAKMFSTFNDKKLPPQEIKVIITFLSTSYNNFSRLLKSASRLKKLVWFNDYVALTPLHGFSYGKRTIKEPFHKDAFK